MLLTALETFLTTTEKNKDQLMEIDSKNIIKKINSNKSNYNRDIKTNREELASKRVNSTMASYFAPLPIIIATKKDEEDTEMQDSFNEEGSNKTIDNNIVMNPCTILLSNINTKGNNEIAAAGITSSGIAAGNIPDAFRSVSTTKQGDTWYIARYGRIYKRKAHSRVGYSQIPCPPGYRYCKECQKPMPLDKFYKNVKRYICRHHHYLRVNKRFKERVLTSDYEKMAESAWLDLFRMCPILGYAKAEYDRCDIKHLVINAKIPLSIAPRAVPIDPSIPMRPRNVAIISNANMSLLLKLYVMTCSRAQYIMLVQSVNLLPLNADAGVPWAPFHNENYVRQDIDVCPILELEKSLPRELPHVEAVWEMMKEEEEKIKACKSRLKRDEHNGDDDADEKGNEGDDEDEK